MRTQLADINVAAEDATLLQTQVAALHTKVETYRVVLDDAQRRTYARLGQRNETFSRDIISLANQNPTIVPGWVQIADLNRDLAAREILMPLFLEMQSITSKLEDTCTALGIDIYEGARGIYKSANGAGPITGVSESLKEIGRRFKARNPRKKSGSGTLPTV